MVEMIGCKIYGFDVKMTQAMKVNTDPNIVYGQERIREQSFHRILKENNHISSKIFYLKVSLCRKISVIERI